MSPMDLLAGTGACSSLDRDNDRSAGQKKKEDSGALLTQNRKTAFKINYREERLPIMHVASTCMKKKKMSGGERQSFTTVSARREPRISLVVNYKERWM